MQTLIRTALRSHAPTIHSPADVWTVVVHRSSRASCVYWLWADSSFRRAREKQPFGENAHWTRIDCGSGNERIAKDAAGFLSAYLNIFKYLNLFNISIIIWILNLSREIQRKLRERTCYWIVIFSFNASASTHLQHFLEKYTSKSRRDGLVISHNEREEEEGPSLTSVQARTYNAHERTTPAGCVRMVLAHPVAYFTSRTLLAVSARLRGARACKSNARCPPVNLRVNTHRRDNLRSRRAHSLAPPPSYPPPRNLLFLFSRSRLFIVSYERVWFFGLEIRMSRKARPRQDASLHRTDRHAIRMICW